MKLEIPWRTFLPRRPRSFLEWGRNLFFTIGALLLGWVGYDLLDARLSQVEQARRFDEALHGARPARTEGLRRAAREGAPVGRIEIRQIGLTAMILEGTEDGTLRRAVGHIRGTPLPGQRGNVSLAGHRDTFFRGLRRIRPGDEITLTTLDGAVRYQVDSTRVIEPEEVGVLDPVPDDILTLVTCYPFTFVGAAPQRFIVRAHRVL